MPISITISTYARIVSNNTAPYYVSMLATQTLKVGEYREYTFPDIADKEDDDWTIVYDLDTSSTFTKREDNTLVIEPMDEAEVGTYSVYSTLTDNNGEAIRSATYTLTIVINTAVLSEFEMYLQELYGEAPEVVETEAIAIDIYGFDDQGYLEILFNYDILVTDDNYVQSLIDDELITLKIVSEHGDEIQTIPSVDHFNLIQSEQVFNDDSEQMLHYDISSVKEELEFTWEIVYFDSTLWYGDFVEEYRAASEETSEGEESQNSDQGSRRLQDILHDAFVEDESSMMLAIQFYFNDPQMASSNTSQSNKVVIQLNDQFFFMDSASFNYPDEELQIVIEIPEQYYEEPYVPPPPEVINDGASDALTFVIIANFVLAQVMGSSMEKLWGMINTLQLILHLPLINFVFPENVVSLYNQMMSLIALDVLPADLIYGFFFEFDEENIEPLSDSFESVGYETMTFMLNLGSVLIFLLAMIIGMVLIELIRYLCLCSSKMQKLRRDLTESIYWNGFIRIILEGFIEFMISAFINIKSMKYDLSGDFISAVLTWIFIFMSVFFPLSIYKLTTKDQWTLNNRKFKKRFGSLYEEMKYEYRSAQLYNFYFALRRLVYAFTFTELGWFPTLQMFIIIHANLLQNCYVQTVRPYNNYDMNRIERWNEYFLLTITNMCFNFSEIHDEDTKTKYGWIVITLTMMVLIYNIGQLVFETCQVIRWKQIRKKRQEEYEKLKASGMLDKIKKAQQIQETKQFKSKKDIAREERKKKKRADKQWKRDHGEEVSSSNSDDDSDSQYVDILSEENEIPEEIKVHQEFDEEGNEVKTKKLTSKQVDQSNISKKTAMIRVQRGMELINTKFPKLGSLVPLKLVKSWKGHEDQLEKERQRAEREQRKMQQHDYSSKSQRKNSQALNKLDSQRMILESLDSEENNDKHSRRKNPPFKKHGKSRRKKLQNIVEKDETESQNSEEHLEYDMDFGGKNELRKSHVSKVKDRQAHLRRSNPYKDTDLDQMQVSFKIGGKILYGPDDSQKQQQIGAMNSSLLKEGPNIIFSNYQENVNNFGPSNQTKKKSSSKKRGYNNKVTAANNIGNTHDEQDSDDSERYHFNVRNQRNKNPYEDAFDLDD